MVNLRVWCRVSLMILSLSWSFCSGASGKELVLVDFSTVQDTVPQGWDLSVKKGNADLRLVREADNQVLQVRSDQSSYALQKKVNLPLQDSPFLVWQWKVTVLPKGGDFRQSDTDDQAAQLIVAFSSSRFLAYIWDSTAPKGAEGGAPAPPFKQIFALVLQSGNQGLGTWITERRNLLEDYKRLYGETPETLAGLRIQINSQHTESQAEAFWKSIVLTSKP